MFLKNKLNTLRYPYELTILLFLLSSPKWFSNKAAKLKKVGSALTAAEALGGKQQQPKTNKEIKQKEDNSIDGGRYMPLYASINRNCIVCRINSETNKLTQILRNSYLQIADILKVVVTFYLASDWLTQQVNQLEAWVLAGNSFLDLWWEVTTTLV